MPVGKEQRFTPAFPCPVCGGDQNRRSGHTHCWGYMSADGTYANCTEQSNGGDQDTDTATWGHYMKGPCRCGGDHRDGATISPPRQDGPKTTVWAGLWYDREGQPKNDAARDLGAVVRKHVYTDADGNHVAAVTVHATPEGERKRVRPWTYYPDARDFFMGDADLMASGRMPLYRSHALALAAADAPIYFVEGEKDADTLTTWGLLATTSIHGAHRGWQDQYTAQLAGHHIIFCGDNDTAGHQFRDKVLAAITGRAASVQVIDIPKGEGVKDVTDWASAGHTVEDFTRLPRRAGPPPGHDSRYRDAGNDAPPTGERKRPKPQPISLGDLLRKKYADPRWAVPGIIPEGLTLLAGKAKMGKSFLILNLGAAISSGGVALGDTPVEQGEVLYLALEDNERRLQARALTLMKHDTTAQMERDFYFITKWARSDQGGVDDLREWLDEHPRARMIVIDTFVKFRKPSTKGANIYEEDSASIVPLQELASERHIAIVVIQHLNKMHDAEDWTDQISGSTGLSGAADTIMGLMRQRGESNAVLKITGRDVSEDDLALDFDQTLGAWRKLGRAEEVARSGERRKVMDVLAKMPEGGRSKQIADRMPGMKEQNLRQLLYKMADDGLIDNFQGVFKLRVQARQEAPPPPDAPAYDYADMAANAAPKEGNAPHVAPDAQERAYTGEDAHHYHAAPVNPLAGRACEYHGTYPGAAKCKNPPVKAINGIPCCAPHCKSMGVAA